MYQKVFGLSVFRPVGILNSQVLTYAFQAYLM